MIKSADKFGSASKASFASNADAVLKPACSNLLLYRFTVDESSSTRKTVLESVELFAVIILISDALIWDTALPGSSRAQIRLQQHDHCQLRPRSHYSDLCLCGPRRQDG